MRTVEDGTGRRLLLLKRSDETSLVADPETGEREYVDNDDLSAVEGAGPLETAAAGVDPSVRRLVTAVPDDRALGLVVTLVDRGPLGVVALLDGTTLCESDLHGLLAELRAAGLIAETEVDGRRGYEATDRARTAIRTLRGE